jgi:flagellar hook-associated protein 2
MAIDTTINDSASIVKSLSMGSGVDIQALAKNLAEAENQSKIDRVTNKKTQAESNISGIGTIASAVGSLKDMLESMKNKTSLVTQQLESSSQSVKLKATGTNITKGSYSVSITQLARPQVNVISVNSSTDTSNLTGTLSVAGQDITISAGDSAQEVVDAINDKNLGVNAQLVNRKVMNGGSLVDDWVISLQGTNGSSNSFSVSVNGVANNSLQTAQDAQLTINGMTAYRSDNVIDDLVPDIELDIRDASAGSTVVIRSSKSYDAVETFVNTLSSTYNDVVSVLDALAGDTDPDEPLAGSLAKERSLVYSIKTQLKSMLDEESATASGGLSSLRDLGLNFAADGTLQVEEKILSDVLANKADDVVAMLSANIDGQSVYTPEASRGLLLQVSINLDALIGKDGVLTSRVSSEENNIADYEDQLADLEQRLQRSYQRYTEQFAAMETFVQQSKEMRNYLENQFKAMQNSGD